MIAFFDTSALIYLMEGEEPFASGVRSSLAALVTAYPDLGVAVSRLAWLECRVGPLKHKQTQVLKAYDDFFARTDLVWVELDRKVIELATQIRANTGLKTPDALQAASALQLGTGHCFLTGDAGFNRVPGLIVKLVTA